MENYVTSGQNDKETGIDCMKYRKSNYLAGIDVETIISEKGSCILTIKECYYAKGIDVSGNKTDGYFIDFVEDLKGMVVNSINRKTISSIVKLKNKCTATESRNIGNWSGLQIELTFDSNVKMMGKTVGGIRVKLVNPTPQISDVNGLAIIKESKTLDDLKANWSKLSKDEQLLPSVIAFKDHLKTQLK